MSSPASPKQNHLLTALPAKDYARLLPDLEPIAMPLGWVVYESGGRLGYVYFPTTCIVSLLYVMESGASAEIAIVGEEGLVGISLFMGKLSRRARIDHSPRSPAILQTHNDILWLDVPVCMTPA